ncbi:MAG: MFS transporter [Nibricoccus sp.]
MLWFVCFFNYADRQAISSVLSLLGREFKFDDVQLGWIGSAFAWVYAAGAPIAGIAADRFSRKWLIVIACVAWSFFTLATGWCNGLISLIIVRALTGLGETFYFPSAMSLLSDYHDKETRSRALSWHQSSVYAGTILGSWMAAELAERAGWRVPFYWFGPIGVVLAGILVKFVHEPERGQGSGRSAQTLDYRIYREEQMSIGRTLGVIFRTPSAMLLMGGFLCANFIAVIFLTWTPKFLVDKFHYSIGTAGLTGTVYVHLASALIVPFAGWLADKMGKRFTSGRMLVQAGGLVLGAIFVFLVGSTNSTLTLILSMTAFGVCKGFYDSGIFASLYDVIEPRARGTAVRNHEYDRLGWRCARTALCGPRNEVRPS